MTAGREYRWRPPVILAVPHATSKDEVFEGILYPANSIVIGNVWGAYRFLSKEFRS
jgi:cytochrome P450